jgi:hypothetical protein
MTEVFYWFSLHIDIVTEDRNRQQQMIASAMGGTGKGDD